MEYFVVHVGSFDGFAITSITLGVSRDASLRNRCKLSTKIDIISL